MKKNQIAWGLGLVMVAFALRAGAQTTDESLYIGGSLGRASHVDACSLGPAPCQDNKDTAYRFFAGYQMNRYLAAEIGWHYFGKATVNGTDIKSEAGDLVAVLTLPLSARFSAYGKLGAYHGTTSSPGLKETKTGPTFGGGLEYGVSRGFALRGEAQTYMHMAGGSYPAEIHIDVVSLAALIRF